MTSLATKPVEPATMSFMVYSYLEIVLGTGAKNDRADQRRTLFAPAG